MRKTKQQLVDCLVAAGFTVTSNRKEGKIDLGADGLPLALRMVEVRIPGSLWSQELGDWCNKAKHRANERRVLKLIKDAVGKAAHFDLCDHDMGHSSEGDAADDAHCQFYVYTSN
jgi:hypothetical protein